MKKGFTLVELAATIVILGILAVIAIPKVTDEIQASREKTAMASLQNYMRALDEQMMIKKFEPGTYDIEELDVKVSGKKPTSGTVIIVLDEIDEVTAEYGNITVKYEKGIGITIVE